VFGAGLKQRQGSKRIQMFGFYGTLPSDPRGSGLELGDFVHHVLPSARGDQRIGRGQVGAGELEVQAGLAEGFVFGLGGVRTQFFHRKR